MKNYNKLYDIDVLRSFGIILVVFFHAYLMMYANHFPNLKSTYKSLYGLWGILPWFHMPLFIFMAGYLYAHQMNKNDNCVSFLIFKGGYIIKKIKRLIIPYFIFSSIYLFIFVRMTNFSSIFGGGVNHLWFIAMLFWCFMLIRLLNNRNIPESKLRLLIILLVSFCFMIFPNYLPRCMGIQYITKWFFWFYLGYSIYIHSDVCKKLICRYNLAWVLPVVYGICMYTQIRLYGYDYESKTIYTEIGFLSAVIWLWYAVNWLIGKFGTGWATSRFILEVSACSFGIYIFHCFVQPLLISRTAQKCLPLAQWATDHVVLFPLFFSLLSLLISYVITRFFLMTRIGKFLIG